MEIKRLNGLTSGIKMVAFDSMCFIYFLEANVLYGPLVKKIFSCLKEKKCRLATSTITLAEILATTKVLTNKVIIAQHKKALLQMKGLTLYPVTLATAEKAAFFRVKYHLKLPDAIQLATALLSECQLFITNNDKMKKVEEIKTLFLKDLL